MYKFSCCPTLYSQISYTVHVKHKPLYFLMYVVSPCVCIAMLILLVFVIPPSTGERTGLGITVLLSMSVYLLVVADRFPETSENAPLLGTFYVLLMFEIAFAFIASVFTLYIYFKKTDAPACLRAICCAGKNTRVSDITDNENAGHKISKANEQGDAEKPWKKIARKLDWWFFWLFSGLFAVTSVGIVLIKPNVEIKALS